MLILKDIADIALSEGRITYTLWSAVFCFLHSLLIWILNMNFLQPDQAIPAFSCIQLPLFPGFSVIWTCWKPSCGWSPSTRQVAVVARQTSHEAQWTMATAQICRQLCVVVDFDIDFDIDCVWFLNFCMIFEFLYDFWIFVWFLKGSQHSQLSYCRKQTPDMLRWDLAGGWWMLMNEVSWGGCCRVRWLALLGALWTHWMRLNQLGPGGHAARWLEEYMQHVGSMLCQFSIVVHGIPRVYVIHTFWLAGFFHMFLQEKIDPGSANLLTGVYV